MPAEGSWTSTIEAPRARGDRTVQTDGMAFQMGDRLHTTVLKITAGTEEREGEGVGDGRGRDQATHLVFGLLSPSKAIYFF